MTYKVVNGFIVLTVDKVKLKSAQRRELCILGFIQYLTVLVLDTVTVLRRT